MAMCIRQRLADLMIKGLLDTETENFLTSELQKLTEQEEIKKSEIYSEESEQVKWDNLQREGW
jgi:hypothetical protein